jgi:hypothetical protein
LDCGIEIYQWNGKDSSLQHKTKTKIFADRVISDRVGKSEFIEVEESEEPLDFLDCLITENECGTNF